MNITAATKIDTELAEKANTAIQQTRLKMADLLRLGLERILEEFDQTGGIQTGRRTPAPAPTKKGGRK